MMDLLTKEAFLLFIIRVILGILFFFQGYDKVFRMKVSGVVQFFRDETRNENIPGAVLVLSAWFTSFAELLGGGLLILGLFKTWAFYLLGIDMIIVCAAFSLLKPMWDMQFLFPRLILLAILLYLPSSWDVIAIDNLLR
jgi:uncharacterized membrane protein YphA (DoxX/SURF4 family)